MIIFGFVLPIARVTISILKMLWANLMHSFSAAAELLIYYLKLVFWQYLWFIHSQRIIPWIHTSCIRVASSNIQKFRSIVINNISKSIAFVQSNYSTINFKYRFKWSLRFLFEASSVSSTCERLTWLKFSWNFSIFRSWKREQCWHNKCIGNEKTEPKQVDSHISNLIISPSKHLLCMWCTRMCVMNIKRLAVGKWKLLMENFL